MGCQRGWVRPARGLASNAAPRCLEQEWPTQRNLFNRLLSALHHCLATGATYDEAKAFPVERAATGARSPA